MKETSYLTAELGIGEERFFFVLVDSEFIKLKADPQLIKSDDVLIDFLIIVSNSFFVKIRAANKNECPNFGFPCDSS